jgi:hypothetical protein
MNQQPDNLFREKLEGYQKPAPASAWEKITAAQSKKNDRWLWLKIAASVTAVVLAGYALLSRDTTTDLSNDSLTAPIEEKIKEELPLLEKNPFDEPKENKTEIAKSSSHSNNVKSTAKSQKKAIEKALTPKVEENLNIAETDPSKQEYLQQQQEETNTIAINETIVLTQSNESPVVADAQPNSITLVYSAKDVEEYLDKKSLAEATSDNKKSSTFKKLLKKANDLTNNQDPFGELRQMKNEILALNFKNEKQRGQNK